MMASVECHAGIDATGPKAFGRMTLQRYENAI
jgi:hypothetical protein